MAEDQADPEQPPVFPDLAAYEDKVLEEFEIFEKNELPDDLSLTFQAELSLLHTGPAGAGCHLQTPVGRYSLDPGHYGGALQGGHDGQGQEEVQADNQAD